MALDKLKRELSEKAVRDAQAQKDKQKAVAEEMHTQREYKESQRPALQCLQLLEDFFWECVNDFSRLANLKIYHTNRPKTSWWNRRPKSSLTLDEPNLYVRFSGFKDDNYDHLSIQFGVNTISRYGLEFTADYGRLGRSITGGGYVEGKTYARVCKNLSVESFEIQTARSWLESNFEEFYKKLGRM
ncbi:MAG: hypothetical protein LH614_09205 [Pyrinomonadaceae bacterium]|nr:hypothetical protein [Pyrinomonadaceae bacterium]